MIQPSPVKNSGGYFENGQTDESQRSDWNVCTHPMRERRPRFGEMIQIDGAYRDREVVPVWARADAASIVRLKPLQFRFPRLETGEPCTGNAVWTGGIAGAMIQRHSMRSSRRFAATGA
jgi:hypothetical protein